MWPRRLLATHLSRLSPEASDFARALVTRAAPNSVRRAKALPFAAARLGSFATFFGLEWYPEMVLRQAVIERFIIVKTPHRSGAMRRTLRSNLLGAVDRGRPLREEQVSGLFERGQAGVASLS